MRVERVAKGLGYFSIGLGLAELLAPRRLRRALGVHGRHAGLLRLFGLREVAAGVALLAMRSPVKGLWARVAGDALDLAALFAALRRSRRRGRLAGALGAVAGVTALDVLTARRVTAAAV